MKLVLKIDWDSIPHNYKWVAIDIDGSIFAYLVKPEYNGWGEWDSDSFFGNERLYLDEHFNLVPEDLIWERPETDS